jgi:hypothetical protein
MKPSTSKKIIKKYFSSNNSSLFFNEIYWLKKFENYEFVPRIIDINYKKYVISISYEGERISHKNKPRNWSNQLRKILYCLKKNNCFHSDIKPDNLLVKNNKLILIDFAQSSKISDLNKNIFLKKRIFFDEYSINRINLSINKNVICSNNLRVLVVWNPKNQNQIEKKIKQNKNISIIDKIKIKKFFYRDKFKDRIFWLDQFYNKKIGKNTDKLKNNIYVFIIKSIKPRFKLNEMIFSKDRRIVDDRIFAFKKRIRNNKSSIIHISDNFEESKRNAIFLSRAKNDFPAKYFFETQNFFNSKKDFFKKLNRFKKLKYVVLRDQTFENDDIDILVNNYFLFKRISDCHSYKTKNLNIISNSGDPVEDNGFKVANYIKIKNKIIKLDVRFIGDGYLDTNWQKKILNNRKYNLGHYIPNQENFIYSLLYHIVYHKGYIDKKYTQIVKKNLELKKINLKVIKKTIENYLLSKKYEIMRPLDLTIPITYHLDNFSIKKEVQLIKSQIDNRNFSGVNKMFYNLIKFQKITIYLKKDIIFLIFLNQICLIKMKLKKFIFKYFQLNN